MISIQNLTKYYDRFCALDHINFEVDKGEILGLLGPNGAGKTTTIRMLTCYMLPSEGNIQIKDLNIYDNPLEIKKMIGYLPESAPIYQHMIVYDYLRYVADIREIDPADQKKRIHHLADLCGISNMMHKNVSELSKGYKQRVGLAHAMMSDPEILVLDEPTSGLDPNQIIEVREIIKEIGKKKTVILSTHILSEVEASCDRYVIINQGKIAADDKTSNLNKSKDSKYDISLILANTSFDTVKSSLKTIGGVQDISKTFEKDGNLGVKIFCASSEDIRGSIYNHIKTTDWILLDFRREHTSLEDVFRKLTKEDQE
ncbi:MAG: ATP-binding cassette domain-containing protein [Spirochaetales bacterium]|nr:ATP-binding cassette domain-containing protein [Spirochaetales bacterium]